MDLLAFTRIVGLAYAVGVGIFRLWKNHLVGEERILYLVSTLTMAYFVFVFICQDILLWTPEVLNKLNHIGWPFMIVTLITFMLFYRRLPRGNGHDTIRDDN